MIEPKALALNQILDHSPFGIAVFNYDGHYESVNPTYCAIYGYRPEELLGHSITTVFPPDKQAWVLGLHQKFLDEGGVLGGEWEVLRRDQSQLRVISESVRLEADDGSKRRLVFVMDITARQRLEEALRISEERLQLVLLGTEDGYFDVDLQNNQRSYSARWWQMLGYTPDAWPLDGQHWQRLTHPDDLARVESSIAAALVGSVDRFEFHVRLRHQSGRYLNILTRAFIGRDAQGCAIRLTGANTDLTERMRFEVEAKHFQSIVESSDDAIISKGLDSVVTSWNAGAEAMFGYSAAEMIGRPITLLLPPDRLDEEDLILQRLREGKKVEHFETVRLHKNGQALQVSVSISPIRNAWGEVVGASKIARDISERKALEAQLQLTASVFDNTQEGIVLIGPEGAILELNPAFSLITGYARADLLGQSVRQFLSDPEAAQAWTGIAEALALHGHYQGEHWSWRKDHQRFAVLLTVSTVRNAQQQAQSYVALFADTTALRLRQEQIEHLAQHDALTDLPNRVLLSDRIQQATVLARRQGLNLAVLYIDLDGFKLVNDVHGHAAGDALLVALALRMKQALRAVDTLARVGGDEFAAVLFDVKGMDECHPLLQRVLLACASPVAIGTQQVQVSASVGVALYPQDDVSAEQLLARADRAMYQAKQSGKNQYRVFER